MQADRHRLKELARRIVKSQQEGAQNGETTLRLLTQWDRQLAASRELYSERQRLRPTVSYDPELPITTKRTEILAALEKHPVVVVCGETGSGKSTQLPKMCLELGRGIAGVIGHTQPRRIAARSVATRLAEELRSPLGQAVGFKVRFTDTTSPRTHIKLMTDGILLAETQGDRYLDQYDTLIIDEAHERSLNIDFLLGYVRQLLPKRPDLRVVITSATIDAERFSEHFASAHGPAPIILASGRSYPVDVWYRPPGDAEDDDEPDRHQAVLDAVDELLQHDHHGDILVFLATEREILEVNKALRGRVIQGGQACEVLPLYARLSPKEQQRVFERHTRRRIILATNVAESSLTVPGIRYVIDEGTARISRYAPRSKIQRLPIEAVSQASADQRKGRCGRLGPGICVRLYSEEDFLNRDRYTVPEIRRSNLAAVILQAEALRLGRLEDFPFLEPPQPNLIRDGYATLFELGAVDAENQLTPLGRQLSRLPADPRIGRIILAGIEEGCLREILIIASALEVQDPRERPVDKQQAADQAHAKFADSESDFFSYIRMWDFYHDLKGKLSRNQLNKACHQNFLSHTRMHEWLEVYRQLRQLVEEFLRRGDVQQDLSARRGNSGGGAGSTLADLDQLAGKDRQALYGRVHRALLVGLLSNVALKTDTNEYTGAGNLRLNLWPGSATFQSKPKWIVAGELVETTRRFARCVAGIQPEWIEPLAGHLVQRSHSDPYWNGDSGSVMAYEKVTLFGLPITTRRPVPYGRVDPEYCRERFIREGLVGGDLKPTAPFLNHNRRLRQETEQLTAKTRRADLVFDDFAAFAFYHQRLPADVYDWARLNRWRKDSERQDPRRLFMALADATASKELPQPEEFPDNLVVERLELPLEYHFEPGADQDGITVVVPVAGLGQLAPERLGWLVPGLLEQKVEAMIRALPKNVRRNLIPVPDTAREVASNLRFAEGDLLGQVRKLLSAKAGEAIPAELFDPAKLPPHLRMNVRVVDERGKTLGVGRDLRELRADLGVKQDLSTIASNATSWHRDGLTKWDFGDLPEQVEFSHGGIRMVGFPTLDDLGEAAGLRLAQNAAEAKQRLRAGVRRLVVLAEQRALKSQVAWLPDLQASQVLAAGLLSPLQLQSDLTALIADRAYLDGRTLPRSADAFQQLLRAGRDETAGAVRDAAKLLGPLFKNYHALRLALETSPASDAKQDVSQQLGRLLSKSFLVTTPWTWLQHFPRYLEGMRLRLTKFSQGGQARDRQSLAELLPLQRSYEERIAAREKSETTEPDPDLETFRWWLEELRVSLFAQQLGTSIPVSVKRLQKQWGQS